MICAALFAIGAMIRDGWPALGTTHGARALGAFICALGALCVVGWGVAALIGGGVLAGFYVDMKHGEGQRARGWGDAGFLLLSGVTSVAPAAAAIAVAAGVIPAGLVLAAGLLKPGIWFAWWRVIPDGNPTGWLQPCRLAAMTFGAALGAAVSFLA